MDPLLVTLTDGDTTAFIVVHPQGQSDRYKQSANNNGQSYHINSFVNPSDVVSSNTNINFWGDTQTTKIYGYSDRGLYKAGETIYFAGFVRNLTQFGSLDYLKGGTVAVHIADVQGNAIYDAPALPLDEFGGFK